MGRRELRDPGEQAGIGERIVEGEILAQRAWVHAPAHGRMGRQRADLGGEEQAALAVFGHKQRFFAHAVACQDEGLAGLVPQGEGKHAIQARDEIDTPATVGLEHDLGVARCAEMHAALLQLAAQVSEIVYFAVDDDEKTSAGVPHRLVGGGTEIDDAEAAVAQHQWARGGDAAGVGPTVAQALTHGFDHAHLRRPPPR